jgi:hypothetical protein
VRFRSAGADRLRNAYFARCPTEREIRRLCHRAGLIYPRVRGLRPSVGIGWRARRLGILSPDGDARGVAVDVRRP